MSDKKQIDYSIHMRVGRKILNDILPGNENKLILIIEQNKYVVGTENDSFDLIKEKGPSPDSWTEEIIKLALLPEKIDIYRKETPTNYMEADTLRISTFNKKHFLYNRNNIWTRINSDLVLESRFGYKSITTNFPNIVSTLKPLNIKRTPALPSQSEIFVLIDSDVLDYVNIMLGFDSEYKGLSSLVKTLSESEKEPNLMYLKKSNNQTN